MPPFRVHVEILGDTIIEGHLAAHAARVADPMPAFVLLAERFLEIEKAQFESQGATGGVPWSPLAASTLVEKTRLGYDLRILHRSHAMRDSLTNAEAPGAIRRITPQVLELGTDVSSDGGFVYPMAHQEGRGVPQRKPVNLNDIERGLWAKTIHRYITTGELIFGVKV